MRKEVVVVAAVSTAATIVVVAALVRQWRRRKEEQWKQTQTILRKFATECATPVPRLWLVANALVSEMEASLASNETTGDLNMLLSYLASLPNGYHGREGTLLWDKFEATEFLILCARLGGKNEPISDLHREEISIPSDVMMCGTSQELFDYIAGEFAKFIHAHPESGNDTSAKEKKLGFTWSRSVDHVATLSASAIKWKNLAANDMVGETLVTNINQALAKRDLNMRVYTLRVDDTIGSLAGGRFYNTDCVAAVTLGMGTNAAYVESSQAVPKWQGPSPKSDEIVLSTEWGNFSSSYFPVTEFDASLDAESLNPGSMIFEKLVSGLYLGEIVRRVLLRMAKETALFGDTVPPKLMLPYLLRSPDMATMHQDTSEDHELAREKLKEVFGITNSTPKAREVIVEVCDIVTERAARLAAAGIVGIIKKLGRIELKKSVVNVQGGLYEHYRIFRNYLHSSVWEMIGNELSDNVVVEPSHGGSGAGALFLAASQTQNPK